jgi:hypothetical protein
MKPNLILLAALLPATHCRSNTREASKCMAKKVVDSIVD